MIDWTAAGGVAAMILSGAAGWFGGRRKRAVEASQDSAQISSYKADQTTTDAAAAQIRSLVERVELLETKYNRLWDDLQKEKEAGSRLRDRVHQLEAILRSNNIPVPPDINTPEDTAIIMPHDSSP